MVAKIIEAIRAGTQALEAGKELQNPAAWKNKQRTTSLVLLLLLGAYAVARILFPDVSLEMGAIEEAAAVIAGILALLANWFLTTATSKKVGKGPKK